MFASFLCTILTLTVVVDTPKVLTNMPEPEQVPKKEKDEQKEKDSESPSNGQSASKPSDEAVPAVPPVREITQTDRLNQRLLASVLERMKQSDDRFDKFREDEDDEEEKDEFQ